MGTKIFGDITCYAHELKLEGNKRSQHYRKKAGGFREEKNNTRSLF